MLHGSHMKLLLSLALSVFAFTAGAQTLLYGEDFSSGSPLMTLNTSGVGANNGQNQWTVNSTYTGNATYPTTTAQTNTVAGTITNAGGNYLHIVNSSATVTNANYSASNASDRFAVTDNICTIGYTAVTFSFFYLCEGRAADFGEVYYRVNGGAWTQLGSTFNNQSIWRYQSFTNPAFNNVSNLQFGFRWKNGGSGTNNLPFAIDDILVSGTLNVTPSITITSVPTQVCQGLNMTFSFQITPPLCAGDYSISLLNGATTVLSWQVTNMTTTSGAFSINIPTTVPIGNCYRIRMARVSGSNPPKPPFFIGTQSACIRVVACPNTITTLQPVVTIGSTPGAGDSVCVGSVMDVPFWSTGTFNNNNVYTAMLSDSAGNFGTTGSLMIGSNPDRNTYDPTIVPSPGSVSGVVPNVPEGCNYYIRVESSSPITPTTSITVWGPFCIKNCDIRTNRIIDLFYCISTVAADSSVINIDINTPPKNVSYGANNQFEVEVLDMMFFARVYKGTGLGFSVSQSSTTMQIRIPPLAQLRALGLDAGAYYLRIVSTNPALKGSVIRMTIGAPYVTDPLEIWSSDTVMCLGGAVFFNVNRFRPPMYNRNSDYQWFLGINGATPTPFPAPPPSPRPSLGVRFNITGTFQVQVQETNYGCVGPLSPAVTVSVTTKPNSNLNGQNLNVCLGDTIRYTVPFFPVTQYNWTLEGGGKIVDTSNNQIRVAWDSLGLFKMKLAATNFCGNDVDSVNIRVHPNPVVDAGLDINICIGEDTMLNGTASGQISQTWIPLNGLSNPQQLDPTVSNLTDTTRYILSATGLFGCQTQDTMYVNVAPLPIAYAGEDTFICNYQPIQLNGGIGPNNIYEWSGHRGTLNDTTIPNPTANPVSPIIYYLKVTDPVSACFAEDTLHVAVSSLRQETPKYYQFCRGDSILLTNVIEGYDFTWNTGSTEKSILVKETGTFWVDIWDIIGCEITNEYNVFVTDPVFEPMGHDTLILCIGNIDTLIGRPLEARYKWSTGETTQMKEVNTDGTYYLQLFDENNCAAVDTYHVKMLNDCDLIFYMPNTFTPNRDGRNEVLAPKTHNISDFEFWVFDRWGNQLFYTDEKQGFSGNSETGEPYPIGTYSWKVTYKDLKNQTQIHVGTFNLLR